LAVMASTEAKRMLLAVAGPEAMSARRRIGGVLLAHRLRTAANPSGREETE
jgi:hypothetical protein